MTRMRDSKLLTRLASLRLAAVLIAALAALSLLAVIVPQRDYLGAAFQQFAADVPWLASALTALGLDRLFGGWPIVVVSALLVVNLAACTLRRVLLRPAVLSPGSQRPDGAAGAVADALEGAGWDLLEAGQDRVTGRRGASGFTGSIVMHVGLIVIVAGGVASAVTAFRGEMVISGGQTVTDAKAAYLTIGREPWAGPAYSGTRIALDSTDCAYEDGTLVSAVAHMRAVEPDGRIITKDVRVNHPLDAGGKSYLLQTSGYAVRMVVQRTGSAGEPLVVALAQETPNGWTDHVDLAGVTASSAVTIDMLATPVPMEQQALLPADKFVIKDPRLHLRIVAGADSWEGVLAPGTSSPEIGGTAVTFEDLGLWNRYLVRGEPARWVTYLGFWVAILGAAWRFSVPERRLLVRFTAGGAARVMLRSRPWSGPHAREDAALTERLSEMAGSEGDEDGRSDW